MKQAICFLFSFFFTAEIIQAQPRINSVLPGLGKPGDTVRLFGSNFSNNPADNIIYTGPARASVITAAADSLKFIVPRGSGFGPTTLTTNSLTAYAGLPFLTTFSGPYVMTQSSFESSSDVITGATPVGIISCDVDTDEKVDIVFTNSSGNVTILKNAGTPGTVSFQAPVVISTGGISNSVSTADFDGDGKLDLCVSNAGSSNVVVLINTSTLSQISFSNAGSFSAGFNPLCVTASDIDTDGKPDMIICNPSTNTFSVLRNTSTPGTVSFAAKIDFSTSQSPRFVCAGDLNKDGKPDIVVACQNSFQLCWFTNTSTPGTVSFGSQLIASTGFQPYSCAIGDLDSDGWQDVAVVSGTGDAPKVFRNTTTTPGGSPSFDFGTTLLQSAIYRQIIISEFTGDGKPDVAALTNSTGSVVCFPNNSTPGNMTFGLPLSFFAGGPGLRLTSADYDNDSIPDFAFTRSQQVGIIRNRINAPVVSSFSPVFGISGDTVTISGKNFINASGVSIGGEPVSFFQIVNADTIKAVVGTAARGAVSVTSPAGTHSLKEFTLPPPVITHIVPDTGAAGIICTIYGHQFSPIPDSNLILLGSIRVPVITASADSVNIKIPAGMGSENVQLITKKLIAKSPVPFTYTFPGGGSVSSRSFEPYVTFAATDTSYIIRTADIDGDGKPDLLIPNYNRKSISIYRNISTPGRIMLAPPVQFSCFYRPDNIETDDLNGDGKPELIISNYSSLSIYRNNSSPGIISFTALTDYDRGGNAIGINVADLNNDGKPDVFVGRAVGGAQLLRNITPTDNTEPRFASSDLLSNNLASFYVAATDLDRNNTIDILPAPFNGFPKLIKNKTPNGNANLNLKVQDFAFPLIYSSSGISVGDFDKDDSVDVAFLNDVTYPTPAISIYKQKYIGDSLTFIVGQNRAFTNLMMDLKKGDFNGDGWTDLMTLFWNRDSLLVLENKSSPGVLNMEAPALFKTAPSPFHAAVADLDTDGRPDIAIIHGESKLISVFRNKSGLPQRIAFCPSESSGTLSADISGSAYQWQLNDSMGYVNITDGLHYSGTNSQTLQLLAIPSSWYGYSFRCIVNGIPGEEYKVVVRNSWTGAVNTSWNEPGNWSCNAVPDQYTDVIIPGGIVEIGNSTTIRSLILDPGASLTVSPGASLVILH